MNMHTRTWKLINVKTGAVKVVGTYRKCCLIWEDMVDYESYTIQIMKDEEKRLWRAS